VTRIIGGSAGGRRLRTPSGEATRPTSDRVREALFSSIESWAGTLQGLRFLDLYAGSGAVGLEAWSRGADAVTLVESDRRTAGIVRSNAQELGADVEVVTGTVRGFLDRPSSPDDGAYDVVFSDPPYPLGSDVVAADLAALVPWLGHEALVVVERSSRSPDILWPEHLERDRTRRYGETVLWYGHAP
jgi:16S rRNA (guanine966-N2)-methyltransferase